MWFRIFLAGWSLVLLALLGWLSSHQSSEKTMIGRYSPGYFALLMGVAALATVSLLAQVTTIYRRLHAKRRELVLVLLSILVSLIIVELAIRLFDPLGISYLEESSRYHSDKIPDPVLVYKHAPGLRRTYQGVVVSINELGLRDRELEKKAAGELRILLLGDSVTFGWGVPIEATFGRKLETLLTSKLGHPVRVVNSGVGSYNTVQEYAFLRTHSGVIEPDVVVLLYVENDIEPNDGPFVPGSQETLRGKSAPEVIGILLGKSWLYRLGLFVKFYLHSDNPASFDANTRGVKESMDALSGVAAFCRERGIGFATIFYRTKGNTSAPALSVLLSEIRTIGEKYDFPVGDTASWWGDVDMRSVTNSTVDSHLNERGNDILALGMEDFLMKHGLVGKTGQTPR